MAIPAVSFPAPAHAQRFAKEWVGSVKATHQSVLGYTTHLEGRLKFAYSISGPVQDDYDLVGDSLMWTASGSGAGCTFSGGPVYSHDEAEGFLVISYDDSTYAASTVVDKLAIFNTTVRGDCPEGQLDFPNYGSVPLLVMSRQETFKMSEDGRVLRGSYTFDHPEGPTLYEWDLFGDPDDDLELVVRSDDYEGWLPSAGPNEYAGGSSMILDAILRRKDGSPPTQGPEFFRFELVSTSREPGVAMNYPSKYEALTTPDLRFSNFDEPLGVGPESLWVEMPGLSFDPSRSVVMLSSYDGGAYGTLTVTATMPDGRKLTGHLEGDGSMTQIPLPKRSGGSLIGDRWKEESGASSLADDDDSEDTYEASGVYAGHSHPGDGLTLYEEYRGFLVGRRHTRGDPKKRDLFVLNDVGAEALPGIKLFEALTGMVVHHRLAISEFDRISRVVNQNVGSGPHVVDQHGLWIKEKSGAFGQAVGSGPGPPKTTMYIRLADAGGFQEYRRGRSKVLTEILAPHTAHELLHAVNVWHHGGGDLWEPVWSVQRNAQGQTEMDAEGYPIVTEDGMRTVIPRTESGHRFVPVELFIIKNGRYVENITIPMIGIRQGQHSGYEDCVMRYESAAYYAVSAQAADRYEAEGGELVGIRLCSSEKGTGVNASSRRPRPRYGDAADGDCTSQICVNDRYH